MIYMARWGNKGFIVNPSIVVPLEGFSTSFKRKSDTNEDTSGQPSTNTRGMELQPIHLETTYLAGAGVDPLGQIEDWKKQFDVKAPLLLNGKQFGPALLQLDSVSFDNFKFDGVGRIIQVDASIDLTEYVAPTTKVSEKTATTATSSTKSGALSAGPTSAEKAAKKTTTAR